MANQHAGPMREVCSAHSAGLLRGEEKPPRPFSITVARSARHVYDTFFTRCEAPRTAAPGRSV